MPGEVTEEDIAKFAMLKGLNYDAGDISEATGYDESTIYRYLNELEERAKAADDWEDVYWDVVVAGIFDGDFRSWVAQEISGST